MSDDISYVEILKSGFAGFGKQLRLRDKIHGFTIDLCDIPDKQPFNYEMAIFHPDFADGQVIIVGYATNEEEARELFINYCAFINKIGPHISNLRDVDTGEIIGRSF